MRNAEKPTLLILSQCENDSVAFERIIQIDNGPMINNSINETLGNVLLAEKLGRKPTLKNAKRLPATGGLQTLTGAPATRASDVRLN
jgi:hypothetical protein